MRRLEEVEGLAPTYAVTWSSLVQGQQTGGVCEPEHLTRRAE